MKMDSTVHHGSLYEEVTSGPTGVQFASDENIYMAHNPGAFMYVIAFMVSSCT